VTSFLEAKGAPGVVERTLMRPPSSWLGPILPEERRGVVLASPVAGKYDTLRDRESAYELLKARAETAAAEAEEAERAKAEEELRVREYQRAERYTGTRATTTRTTSSRSRQPETLGDALSSALVKELSGTTGKRLVRGILGGLFRGR
jgi:uncharacterized protein